MKRAVLIGINYYGQAAELSGCINDITDVHTWLLGRGYECTVLCDADGAEARPTHDNIIAVLRAAVADTRAGDTLYIHYSGHGSYVRDIDGDEADGRDECICPVDNKFITDDTLNAILVADLVPGAKLRAVFDSCHSGSVLDLPYLWMGGSHFVSGRRASADVITISGCRDAQTSADAQWSTPDGGSRGNGALTRLFLHEMSTEPHESPRRWSDLCSRIQVGMRQNEFEQIPCLSVCLRGDINRPVDI